MALAPDTFSVCNCYPATSLTCMMCLQRVGRPSSSNARLYTLCSADPRSKRPRSSVSLSQSSSRFANSVSRGFFWWPGALLSGQLVCYAGQRRPYKRSSKKRRKAANKVETAPSIFDAQSISHVDRCESDYSDDSSADSCSSAATAQRNTFSPYVSTRTVHPSTRRPAQPDIQYLNEGVEEESCGFGWFLSGLSEGYVRVMTVTHDTQFSESLINSDHQWLMEG